MSMNNLGSPTGFRHKFLNALQEEIDNHSNALLTGSADSYSQYKQTTGYLNGINFALRNFNDLWTQMTNSGEDFYNDDY